MCRHLTKEQQDEGWRTLGTLLAGLRPRGLSEWAAALAARLLNTSARKA